MKYDESLLEQNSDKDDGNSQNDEKNVDDKQSKPKQNVA